MRGTPSLTAGRTQQGGILAAALMPMAAGCGTCRACKVWSTETNKSGQRTTHLAGGHCTGDGRFGDVCIAVQRPVWQALGVLRAWADSPDTLGL